MVARLAGRGLQLAYRHSLVVKSSRHLHTSFPVQESWFGRLFKGLRPAETTETQQKNLSEQEKPPHLPQPPDTLPSLEFEKAQPQDLPTGDTTLKSSSELTPEATELARVVKSARSRKNKNKNKKGLSSAHKLRHFDEQISFMEPRLGRPPKIKFPSVGRTTWIHVLDYCQTEEQLKRVIKLIPQWKIMRRKFDVTFSNTFIRRCINIKKPEVALEVFSDFKKYNVPLTLDGARELLNAMYNTQPIESILTLRNLYRVYRLKPIATDFPSCAMVIAACLKNPNKDAQSTAGILIPHLKAFVKKKRPLPLPEKDEITERMPLVWGIHAAGRVDRLLSAKDQAETSWLHNWRVRSGHIPVAAEV